MTMAAIEAAIPIFSVYSYSPSKFTLSPKQLPFLRVHVASSIPTRFRSFPLSPLRFVRNYPTTNHHCFELSSALQEVVVEEQTEQTVELNQKRKLFVVNIPWSFSVVDMKNLFGQCGTVKDIEIIKQNNGKSRRFAFVTMASAEEAQAVIDKFDSHEISGRIIRIQFARSFKKPSLPSPQGHLDGETQHKLYVSNLAWKVRSTHLRDFFSENFKPASASVIFDAGKPAGYGFVSFATQEEAEAAISALDGKELMGRPLRLKFSQKNVDEAGSEKEEAVSEDQQEEAVSEDQQEEAVSDDQQEEAVSDDQQEEL